MENQLINNLDFAQKNKQVSEEIALSLFERLQDMIVHNPNCQTMTYTLEGVNNHHELPRLGLHIQAQVSVACQRCFKPVSRELDLHFTYVVSEAEPEEDEYSDEFDWLEPEAEMDLLNLIEDELLLAMPFAPSHCDACNGGSYEVGEKVSPFAQLKGKFK